MNPDNSNDDVRAAQGGDGAAFARLIACHQAAVANFLWRFTRDRGRLEELVHEVFVEAYFSLRSYSGRGPFTAWLRQIATRLGYKFWQRQERARAEAVPLAEDLVPPAADPGPAERLAASEAAELVHAWLARLSPRDRLVLTLMYHEQCSVVEIAELTGWSQSSVKVQAHRARERLKRLMQSALPASVKSAAPNLQSPIPNP